MSKPKRKYISASVRKEVLEKYDNTCAYCGKEGLSVPCKDSYFRAAIDHVVPVEKGGSSDISNLQLLCNPCNTIKGSKSMDDFVAHMRRREETALISESLSEEIPGIDSALLYFHQYMPHDRQYALLKPIYEYINSLKGISENDDTDK